MSRDGFLVRLRGRLIRIFGGGDENIGESFGEGVGLLGGLGGLRVGDGGDGGDGGLVRRSVVARGGSVC